MPVLASRPSDPLRFCHPTPTYTTTLTDTCCVIRGGTDLVVALNYTGNDAARLDREGAERLVRELTVWLGGAS